MHLLRQGFGRQARWSRWLLAGVAVAVVSAAIYVPRLRRRVRELRRSEQRSEEQARREFAQPVITSPGDVKVKARMFWASGDAPGTLAPVVVELPLSNDPVLRAKQVLNTLLAGPVDADLRTVPADAALLEFYLQPDGTGIADFSEELSNSMPSGIESEQRAVDSIARTLEANVPQVWRLKILIHGQEVETLAGHVDLTGYFLVNAKAAPALEKLTPAAAPGKLSEPARKR